MITRTPRKPEKTFGDYLAIGVSPALIMVLVGSLVFFLAELSYHGAHGDRLRFTLGCFVLASVLISRIAIELGKERAFLYGLALGGVTSLWLIRNVEPPFVGIVLLGVIWWCVNKLVWDCTMIEDDEDATGEGLLDAVGLHEGDGKAAATSEAERPRGRLVFWQHATKPAQAEDLAAQDAAAAEGNSKVAAHTPGVWVIYFSLGALPLFGFGQTLLPRADAARRAEAFGFLWFYVLAAFGLLITTSFLGLRRYLRQRYLRMPANIALSWTARGTATALAVMVACVLLPRPDAAYSLSALAERLGSPPVPASKSALPTDSAGEGEGRAGGKSDAPNPRPASGGDANAPTGEPNGSGKPADDGAAGKGRGGDSSAKGPSQSGSGNAAATAPPASPSPIPSNLGQWLKWLVYAGFAIVALLILFRHGAALWQALCQLWRDFLALLGGRQAEAKATAIASVAPRPPRPFAAFRNPFSGGQAGRFSSAELVHYTFDALQAWATDYGCTRRTDETPLEFAARLREALPEISDEVQATVRHYARVAYAGGEPDADCLATLRQLWGYMSSHAALRR
jgi:Domain of unknown function (DUF4129)